VVRWLESVVSNVIKFVDRTRIYAINRYRGYVDKRRILAEIDKNERIKTEDGELVIIYGGLGVGKTTYLCQIGKSYCEKGREVYTNIPDTPFKAMPAEYYNYRYPRGSCILIDEIGILHDNRQYKNLPEKVRDWYKYVRHHGLHVFACSQTADLDKKIRVLATEQELIKKERYFLFFKVIIKYLIIPEIGYIDQENGRFYAEDYYSVVRKSVLRLKKYYWMHNSHSELDIPLYIGDSV